ncbi:hypothetical protein ACROYT_G040617 [Oculina patagonica]
MGLMPGDTSTYELYRYLSSNKITFLSDRVFENLTKLTRLYLQSNKITFLSDRVFANLTKLIWLNLSSNAIKFLPDRVFATLTKLAYLYLSSNNVTFLPDRVFENLTNMYLLFLNANLLEHIPYQAFVNMNRLEVIMLSDNPLKTIAPEISRFRSVNLTIYLLRTKLKALSFDSIIDPNVRDFKLVLWKRTPRTLKYYSIGQHAIYLNPHSSHKEAIKVDSKSKSINERYIDALLASGFRQVPHNSTIYKAFLPCPLGTFVNSSSKGYQGCIECSPGNLNSS